MRESDRPDSFKTKDRLHLPTDKMELADHLLSVAEHAGNIKVSMNLIFSNPGRAEKMTTATDPASETQATDLDSEEQATDLPNEATIPDQSSDDSLQEAAVELRPWEVAKLMSGPKPPETGLEQPEFEAEKTKKTDASMLFAPQLSHGSPGAQTASKVSSIFKPFFRPWATIPSFSRQFSLGPYYDKLWAGGIRIWSSAKYAKRPISGHTSPLKTEIIKNMVETGLIVKSAQNGFRTDFFLIPKGDGEVRPIFNFSNLTKTFATPKFYLPNIFQVAAKQHFPTKPYFVKVDFAQAFFNIPVHPSSQYLLSFKYGEQTYRFTRMPFGVSLAPFVCQKMLNAMLAWLRERVSFTWGHIDDLILVDPDPLLLKKVWAEFRKKCFRAGWFFNDEKSTNIPTTTIQFLGSIWTRHGVRRLHSVSNKLFKLVSYLCQLDPPPKDMERVAGFFNFYTGFAGKWHAYVNRWLTLSASNRVHFLQDLTKIVKVNFIPYGKSCDDEPKEVYSDATETQVAAVTQYEDFYIVATLLKTKPILINELLSSFLAIALIVRYGIVKGIRAYTDNMGVRAFWRRGTCRWNLPMATLYAFLEVRERVVRSLDLTMRYVPSANNPADYWSRVQLPADHGNAVRFWLGSGSGSDPTEGSDPFAMLTCLERHF